MNETIYLSELLEKTGLDSEDWVLVRHTLNNKLPKQCLNMGRESFEEYQKFQSAKYFNNKKYIISFIGGRGTTARLFGVYEDTQILSKDDCKDKYTLTDFPYETFMVDEGVMYHDLRRLNILEDYIDRLVIDWGGGTANIRHNDATKKPIVSIANKIIDKFPGYDDVTLPFEKMCEVVSEPGYEEWQNALSNVFGIYLVLDTKSGKQYVGSASGSDGILGRWREYSLTEGTGGKLDKDEGNKGIIEHLKKHPKRYLDFQYTILQILPKTYTQKQVVDIETKWKNKLGTKGEWGLNRN